jgi:hypothetical protein
MRCLVGQTHSSRPDPVAAVCWLSLWLLVWGGGCGDGQGTTAGSSRRAEQQRTADEGLDPEPPQRREAQPEFEGQSLRALPHDARQGPLAIKPGHWTATEWELVANHADFLQGQVTTDPLPLRHMPYQLGTSRPALLPKGQPKKLELVLYVPPGTSGTAITTRLRHARSEREVFSQTHTTRRLEDHQFLFVVLVGENPDRYAFLSELDSLRPKNSPAAPYYDILVPAPGNRVPLASGALCWTSMAYLLWDGLNPDVLDPSQQQALLDWLHWGGQLIVSGPNSLDRLQGSFLAPYLPCRPGRDLLLTPTDLAPLGDAWITPQERQQPGRSYRPLQVAAACSGKQLLPAQRHGVRVLVPERGTPGEPLVVEGDAGRGRIVVTAFSLSQRELGPSSWSDFDNFFNACLLRRPPRVFRENPSDLMVEVHWADASLGVLDPRWSSQVRYFTRDARTPPGRIRIDGAAVDSDPGEDSLVHGTPAETMDGAKQPRAIGPGVAGWRDFNVPSNAAREVLRRAAGIRIPKASFVIYGLTAYLVVLVPVNWLVFRLLGRVEWAWVAVPFITLAGAAGVVHYAQLDIGFARTRTELGVVELYGSYRRAHVTRYTALYTSLGTTYSMQFDDETALVLPFPRERHNASTSYMRSQDVHYHREAGGAIRLEGFEVLSNSTSFLHSEHMLELGGALAYRTTPEGRHLVRNDTALALRGVAVIAGKASPRRAAWVGELPPGAEAELRFETIDDPGYWFPQRAADSITSGTLTQDIDLRPLVELAEAPETFEPGEVRLVAWTLDEVPGVKFSPRESQPRFATLVVAHLAVEDLADGRPADEAGYGRWGKPQSDRNTRAWEEEQARTRLREAAEP